jgi:hypothetical protein
MDLGNELAQFGDFSSRIRQQVGIHTRKILSAHDSSRPSARPVQRQKESVGLLKTAVETFQGWSRHSTTETAFGCDTIVTGTEKASVTSIFQAHLQTSSAQVESNMEM